MKYIIYSQNNKIPSSVYGIVYDLLEKSFPSEERRCKKDQEVLLENSMYNLLVAYIDDKVAGFMALWDFDGFLFIEHFAFDPSFRNKGLGTQMLAECKKLYPKPVILESEPEDTNEMASRRIEFYKRNGFAINNYEYFQPPLQYGHPYIPLKIMSFPTAIDIDNFVYVKNTLYTIVYGLDKKA